MKEPSKQEIKPKQRRKLRYTKVGSVVLSFDFYLGVPLGLFAAFVTLLSEAARTALPSMLMSVAGIGAAIVTLVLTAMAVLIATISPEYSKMLKKVPGGVSGTAKPFLFVAKLAAAATSTALISSGLVPALAGDYLLVFIGVAIPYSLILWSLLGCVQIASQLVLHWETNLRALEIVPTLESKGKL